jgi:uncharacterized damage-inducible protein DinB
MTTTFESDLASARESLASAREELLALVDSLGVSDLDRARRGGWSVARALQHVIQGEHLYARGMAHLTGSHAEAPSMPSSAPDSASEARQQLDSGRTAFLAALEGVDEGSLYAIRPVGHEEFSALSLMENVAHHDLEHAAQIREIVAS